MHYACAALTNEFLRLGTMFTYIRAISRNFVQFMPESVRQLHAEHWIILAIAIATWINAGFVAAHVLR